ncbi:MAG: hypothetical protein AB7F86_03170 [Bdellovibrionales bacterium]
MQTKDPPLLLKDQSDALRSAEFVFYYVMRGTYHLHGKDWLGSLVARPGKPNPREGVPRTNTTVTQGSLRLDLLPDQIPAHRRPLVEACQTPADLLRVFQIKGVREDSRLGLLHWLSGEYELILTASTPTPHEVLKMQTRGQRVVTVFSEPELQWRPMGRHPHALAFTLHDLEHAHKFFANQHSSQVRFFQCLKTAYEDGAFSQGLRDPQFTKALEYLMADMNSHPAHLSQYLRAIVFEAQARGIESPREYLSKISEYFLQTH